MTEAFALRALLADEAQGTEEPGTVDGVVSPSGPRGMGRAIGRRKVGTHRPIFRGALDGFTSTSPRLQKDARVLARLRNDGPIKRTSADTTETQEDEWRLTRRRLGG